MRKFFSIGHNQVPVLITLMVVILLGAVYLFVYIPGNEREINEQHFRTLQRIDKNIHEKIDNNISLMNQLLNSYTNPAIDTNSITGYLKKFSSPLFTLSGIELAADTSKKIKDKRKKLTPIDTDFSDTIFSALQVTDALKEFKLYAAKRREQSVLYMSMQCRFDQFLNGLLPENIFDEYVVFSKRDAVYETFPTGLSYENKDSLLNVRGKVAGSSIRDQVIGGVNYKMFLQPVGFDSANEWIVAGLLTEKRYDQEKKQLPSNIVLIMVIVALVLMLALPWLKLFQMGSRDRLTLSDGSLSFLVAMLLMSMLFFILLWSNTACCNDETKESEKNLADGISKAFYYEIEAGYNQLTCYDSLIQDTSYKSDINRLGKNAMQIGDAPADSTRAKGLENPNLSINMAFWLNSKGDEIYNWTSADFNAPHGNYKEREYFKKIADNKYYFLNGNTAKSFYVDQGISWTFGSFRTVISLPSKMEGAVAALSLNLKCLDNVVMPADCQFAITNDKGEVLYHFDKSRNLNENLIEEFSEKDQLVTTYKAHAEGYFSTDYYQKQYDVYITPLEKLPYFLVILSDKDYIATRDIQVFGFSLSMLLLFILFPLIELLAIVIVIISSKNSSFKNRSFAASWLWPKRTADAGYITSALFNISVIIVLLCFYRSASFAEYFFMLLLAVSFITICFNCFITKHSTDKKSRHSVNKKRIIRCMCIFVFILTIIAVNILQQFYFRYLIFFAITVTLLVFFIYKHNIVIGSLKKVTSRINLSWNYVNSYALMAVTRFIITSGIPVVLFYTSSFNYQQALLARYKQVEFANQLSKKNSSEAIYTDGLWIDTIVPKKSYYGQHYSHEDKKTIDLFNGFRFYKNDISNNEKKLYEINTTDSVYSFPNIFSEFKNGGRITSYIKGPGVDQGYLLSSAPLMFNALQSDTRYLITFWLLFSASLVVFYFVILAVIKKVFALNLPDLDLWKMLDKHIFESDNLNQRIFIIGAPGSKKLEKIKENKQIVLEGDERLMEKEKVSNGIAVNAMLVDFIYIPVYAQNDDVTKKNEKGGSVNPSSAIETKATVSEINKWEDIKHKAINGKHRYIIVDHFSYNIYDSGTNREKLNFLENIRLANKKVVYILSNINPYIFLNSLKADQKGDDNFVTDFDLHRWIEVLGHFRIVTLQLTKDVATSLNDPEWKFRINREIKHGHFLNRLSGPLKEIAEGFGEAGQNFSSEALALKIQLSSQYFYTHVWNTLTAEEKFILYDLAEDGLVNVSDTFNVHMLINKGIIQCNGGVLEIFNKGFSNFVVSSIGQSESINIRKRIKDSGNWSKLKMPLLLILFAILALLLISQQEAYSKIIAYLTALGGGIAALSKITSMFDTSNQKK